jgi:large conductance mechanosensitive channel
MFKKFLQEFKDFALRGNVMSLAVGVIIGSAFQGVVKSLTDNILSPIIGLLTRQNFDSLELDVLGITLRYGAFITSVINFIIMAFVVFLLIRVMNKLLTLGERAKEDKAPDRLCPFCKTVIHPDATRCPACTSQTMK